MLSMYLTMRLNGQEVEKIALYSGFKISAEIARLNKKYEKQIIAAGVSPEYSIESVPSSINNFTPLKRNRSVEG